MTKHTKNFIPSGLDEVFTRMMQTREALRQAGYYDAAGHPRTDEEGQRILKDVRRQVQSHSEDHNNETKRRRANLV